MKPFKIRSKPILQNVIIYKTHKVDKNESPFRFFNYIPIGHKKSNKQKK